MALLLQDAACSDFFIKMFELYFHLKLKVLQAEGSNYYVSVKKVLAYRL